MLKRIGSVSCLACILILLATTSALSHAPEPSRGTSPAGVIAGADPEGPTTTGAGATGDDDQPFIDGQANVPSTNDRPVGKSHWLSVVEEYGVRRSMYLAKRWFMDFWSALR